MSGAGASEQCTERVVPRTNQGAGRVEYTCNLVVEYVYNGEKRTFTVSAVSNKRYIVGESVTLYYTGGDLGTLSLTDQAAGKTVGMVVAGIGVVGFVGMGVKFAWCTYHPAACGMVTAADWVMRP